MSVNGKNLISTQFEVQAYPANPGACPDCGEPNPPPPPTGLPNAGWPPNADPPPNVGLLPKAGLAPKALTPPPPNDGLVPNAGAAPNPPIIHVIQFLLKFSIDLLGQRKSDLIRQVTS